MGLNVDTCDKPREGFLAWGNLGHDSFKGAVSMNWLLIHYFLGKGPQKRKEGKRWKGGWEGGKEEKREGGREDGRKEIEEVSLCLLASLCVCLSSLILSESGIPFTKDFYICEPSRYCLRGSHCTVEWFFWHLYKAEVIFVGGCYDNVQTTQPMELCGR